MKDTTAARAGNPVGRWFADRKVNTKVLIAVGSLAVVAGSVGAVSISKLASVDAAATSVYEQGAVPVGLIGEIRQDTLRTRLAVVNHAVSSSAAAMAGSSSRQFGHHVAQNSRSTGPFPTYCARFTAFPSRP